VLNPGIRRAIHRKKVFFEALPKCSSLIVNPPKAKAAAARAAVGFIGAD
jgi:hypothetical protein